MFAFYLFSVATFVPAGRSNIPEPQAPLLLHLLPFKPQRMAPEQVPLCSWQAQHYSRVGVNRQKAGNIKRGSQWDWD